MNARFPGRSVIDPVTIKYIVMKLPRRTAMVETAGTAGTAGNAETEDSGSGACPRFLRFLCFLRFLPCRHGDSSTCFS
jgi:hypothetical protein